MPGPFDITTKYLIQAYPDDWMSFLGIDTSGGVTVVDAKLSAVSAEVDKVVQVGGATPWLVHVEFQSTYDLTMPERLLRYNTMLHLEYRMAVESTLVLLRRSADGPSVTGMYQVAVPQRRAYLTFEYGVRRLWQEQASEILSGPLGTAPLAPLGASSQAELPALLGALDRRFVEEAEHAEAERLRVVTYTLLGLRYPREIADQLMPGRRTMRDSSTYMAIVEEGLAEGRAEGLAEGLAEGRAEGRAEGERRVILLLGEARLGPIDADARARLEDVTDAAALERLAGRLLTVSSWAELLDGQE